MTDLHIIPSIEQLRQRPRVAALEASHGRASMLQALRESAGTLRARLIDEDDTGIRTPVEAGDWIEADAGRRLLQIHRPSLRRVINATGVIVHTNLGRAPLAAAALDRVTAVAGGYSTLEYDLEAGTRGRRDVHAAQLLCQLTSAEAAVVVNNNAAAALLVLTALAAGREVIISRGELVEIGGGFRVPDVMAQSGAVLREVGTTNRTRAADYAAAVNERTALILRVHQSNFRIEGFTARPALDELVDVGRRLSIPVVEDLGSGNLLDCIAPTPAVLSEEPTVRSSMAAGADLVFFSGDKLLGGPQAGVVVGRRAPIDRLRTHPLMRALRVDKLTYAALEATLLEYAQGRAASTIPVVRMLTTPVEALRARARALAERLRERFDVRILDGSSAIGGGSAPGVALPTTLLELSLPGTSASQFDTRLRQLEPPVIARIENDGVVFDLRTIAPEEDDELGRMLMELEDGRD